MKKLHGLFMAICLAVIPALQSCDDVEGYSLGDMTPPLWATVRVTGSAFYLDCDVWGTLWPVNTNMGWYNPADGQRVITTFNPLWDNYEGFDHAVKILTGFPCSNHYSLSAYFTQYKTVFQSHNNFTTFYMRYSPIRRGPQKNIEQLPHSCYISTGTQAPFSAVDPGAPG